MREHEYPRLLAAIADRGKLLELEEIFSDKQVYFQYLLNSTAGTGSELLKAFGLSNIEKVIGLCIAQKHKAQQVLTAVSERMKMTHPGHGIVFTIPISGASAVITEVFNQESARKKDGIIMEQLNSPSKCELVIAIVEKGYSQKVMDSIKTINVMGGTIVHGKQANIESASKFFGISLQPDKEMVWIITGQMRKAELMQSIAKSCGLLTDARGLVISLPIENCVGATLDSVD